MVGRPGLDPGTLRVFLERPPMSISVQICWLDEDECPPTSTDVLSRFTSWLDNWLDQGSFQGQVRHTTGEGVEILSDVLVTINPGTIQAIACETVPAPTSFRISFLPRVEPLKCSERFGS
jgi:hypothetical protein